MISLIEQTKFEVNQLITHNKLFVGMVYYHCKEYHNVPTSHYKICHVWKRGVGVIPAHGKTHAMHSGLMNTEFYYLRTESVTEEESNIALKYRYLYD